MARTTSGCAWPVEHTAMPAFRSRKMLPSTSSTIAPAPRPGSCGRPRLAVHVHHAGFDGVEELLDLCLVLGIEAGRQPVLGVVGLLHRFVQGVDGPDGNEGDEQLLLPHPVVRRSLDDGR